MAVVEETTTEQRKAHYIDVALENYTPSPTIDPNSPNRPERDLSLPLWLVNGQDLPLDGVDRLFAALDSRETTTSDMDLTQLVRVLYLAGSNQAVQVEIVGRLQSLYDEGDLRFWVTEGEEYFTYWTENHMIMWLSCTYLLAPWITTRDDDLAFQNVEERLRYYLGMKRSYGSYEQFSSVYYKFTLAALVNLFDYSASEEFRQLAYEMFARLLSEVVMATTSEGYFYPAAMRNKDYYYESAPYLDMVWFVTGQGVQPRVADFLGPFLASSDIDLEPFASMASTTEVSISFFVGHGVEEFETVHSSQTREDRTVYQFSAGAYAHPRYVVDSRDFVRQFGLQKHKLLGVELLGQAVSFTPSFLLRAGTALLPGQAKGSNTSGAMLTIYKNRGVALSSFEGLNIGYRGSEQWSCMATVGDIAVFTRAGDRSIDLSNTHLPEVKQQGNTALISYRPTKDVYLPAVVLQLFNVMYSTRVSLFFPESRFDTVEESGRWLFGAKGANYVGVWRHSTQNLCENSQDSCNSYKYFSEPDNNRQAWAVVVGNSATHGTFQSFIDEVNTGQVTENQKGFFSWILDLFIDIVGLLFSSVKKFRWKYETSLTVAGVTLTSAI